MCLLRFLYVSNRANSYYRSASSIVNAAGLIGITMGGSVHTLKEYLDVVESVFSFS